MNILPYDNQVHREQVIALWNAVFNYQSIQSNSELIIDKKIQNPDSLFFVSIDGGELTGTILAGYDGHRGWLYSLCVKAIKQGQGIGSALVKHAEEALDKLGCVKINLQIVSDNAQVARFYEKHGYEIEQRVSMGKVLKANIPS